ncbi:MAG: VacJ family lipoprotein [Halioglobus sp.]|nr:VacJ family lipoprotein [Halioglobus sp.]
MIQRLLSSLSIIIITLLLAACASTPQTTNQVADYPRPIFTANRLLPPDHPDQLAVYDPWEGMNKRIYNFNYHFDRYVFLPVVRGYQWIMPNFAQTGIHNFFKNFNDMITMFNSALQLAPQKLAKSTGRVVVNSTIGILGFIDVATMLGIPRPVEDFGQTLGHWGVGQGPYLVLPFLGPSNVRDSIGLVPDFYVRSVIQDELLKSDEAQITTTVLWPIDTRANTSFRYYETGSAFEYRTVRWLWSTKRDLDVQQ